MQRKDIKMGQHDIMILLQPAGPEMMQCAATVWSNGEVLEKTFPDLATAITDISGTLANAWIDAETGD